MCACRKFRRQHHATLRGHGLRLRPTAISRLEIDDVSQEDLSLVEFIPPDHNGFKSQRALAKRTDHQLSSSLDALRDGNFALARQQFHRTHLAQIHANRIVCTLGLFCLDLGDGSLFASKRDSTAVLALFVLLLSLGHVDAHVIEHRHCVFNLLGGHTFRRKHLVKLVKRHEPPLLGASDHLLDRSI